MILTLRIGTDPRKPLSWRFNHYYYLFDVVSTRVGLLDVLYLYGREEKKRYDVCSMSVPYLSDLDLHSGVTQEAPCLEVILVEVSGEMNGRSKK